MIVFCFSPLTIYEHLIILNIIPRIQNKDIFDESIAVLPFINDSPASENAHLINGYMTEIHSNLCKIKELHVLSLQSAEKYRDKPQSIPEIAKELGVGYLLSARGQIINNRIRLTVQLANANDVIIWLRGLSARQTPVGGAGVAQVGGRSYHVGEGLLQQG